MQAVILLNGGFFLIAEFGAGVYNENEFSALQNERRFDMNAKRMLPVIALLAAALTFFGCSTDSDTGGG